MNVGKTPGLAMRSAARARSMVESAVLFYPKRVQCNICRWSGRRFVSDSWHQHINCPRCRSSIRQRLFFAALQNIDELSFDSVIRSKRILHFAPEEIVGSNIRDRAARYVTADYLRLDCDIQVDMSDMAEVESESVDVVIAFDVLEHVPDYRKALEEVRRILASGGFGIFTVPQKDNLEVTYEDESIVTPEDRTRHFGQFDHLRIFGDDFPSILERSGFKVTSVDASRFSGDLVLKHVLFPPRLSEHPLATNHRRVFFCEKVS